MQSTEKWEDLAILKDRRAAWRHCIHCNMEVKIMNLLWSLWLGNVGVLPVDVVEVASKCEEGQHQQKY